MSYQDINLSFSLYPPPPLSSHKSLLSDLFPSSDHFLPSALFWYILFCSQFDSLLRLSSPPGHFSFPASWGIPSTISQRWKDPPAESLRLGLAILCLPVRQPPASLIRDQKRIYWDHRSTKGMACEVLIDHLVVCTFSHTDLRSHK